MSVGGNVWLRKSINIILKIM